MSDEPEITLGSDNIFADLDLPDAEGLLRKAILTSRISGIVMERKRAYEAVAGILGISVEDLRELIRGRRLRDATVEQLVGYLEALGETVEPFEVTVTDIRPTGERLASYKPTMAEEQLHRFWMSLKGLTIIPGPARHYLRRIKSAGADEEKQ